MNITHKVSEITGAFYGKTAKMDVSLRVITDHIRSATFMIATVFCPQTRAEAMSCAGFCAELHATVSCSA